MCQQPWPYRPLRSSLHPYGFPWLESWRKTKVEQSNSMVDLCLQCITLCISQGIYFLLEHPEDLGSTQRYGPFTRPPAFGSSFPCNPGCGMGKPFVGPCFNVNGELHHRNLLVFFIISKASKRTYVPGFLSWTPLPATKVLFRAAVHAVANMLD